MNLPDEIVEKIMHFAGAYSYNKKLRPYIEEIKIIRNIIEEHGVTRSLVHLQEYYALKNAYNDYMEGYPMSLYWDALHI